MEYPEIGELYHLDDQYLIGSNLLVKPVTGPGVKESTISFPAEDLWFDVDTMVAVERPMGHHDGSFSRTVSSDIDKIPVYQRGGSVIPRKLRLRRSTEMMTNDPYTLYIALDESQMASGSLYMDDEGTFNHVNGEYAMSNFTVDMNESIKCEVVGSAAWIDQRPLDSRLVERLVIMGLEKKPSTLMIKQVTLEFDYSEASKILVIRNPQVSALRDWSIMIQ